jgi:hypothetical protein
MAVPYGVGPGIDHATVSPLLHTFPLRPYFGDFADCQTPCEQCANLVIDQSCVFDPDGIIIPLRASRDIQAGERLILKLGMESFL